jgi:hypothetical protein
MYVKAARRTLMKLAPDIPGIPDSRGLKVSTGEADNGTVTY